jgi:hypothetical protein
VNSLVDALPKNGQEIGFRMYPRELAKGPSEAADLVS